MQRKDFPRLAVINGGPVEPDEGKTPVGGRAVAEEQETFEAPASPQAIRSCLDYLHQEACRAGLGLPAHLIAVARRSLDDVIEPEGRDRPSNPPRRG